MNECEMYPEICENNSTCINIFGDYECICIDGFVGKNCSYGNCHTLIWNNYLKQGG